MQAHTFTNAYYFYLIITIWSLMRLIDFFKEFVDHFSLLRVCVIYHFLCYVVTIS